MPCTPAEVSPAKVWEASHSQHWNAVDLNPGLDLDLDQQDPVFVLPPEDWDQLSAAQSTLISAILVSTMDRLDSLVAIDLAELVSSLAHLGLRLYPSPYLGPREDRRRTVVDPMGSGSVTDLGSRSGMMLLSRWSSRLLAAVTARAPSMGLRAAALTMWGLEATGVQSPTQSSAPSSDGSGEPRLRLSYPGKEDQAGDWESVLRNRLKTNLGSSPDDPDLVDPDLGGQERRLLVASGRSKADLSLIRIVTKQPYAELRPCRAKRSCKSPLPHPSPSHISPLVQAPLIAPLRSLLSYLSALEEIGIRPEAVAWWGCLAASLRLPRSHDQDSPSSLLGKELVAVLLRLPGLVPVPILEAADTYTTAQVQKLRNDGGESRFEPRGRPESSRHSYYNAALGSAVHAAFFCLFEVLQGPDPGVSLHIASIRGRLSQVES